MKIRYGFVSNSSATSFCIFGWNDYDLNKSNIDIYALEIEIKNRYNIDLIQIHNECGDILLGLGNYDDEFDHWYGENWQEYTSEAPPVEEVNLLKKIAEEMKLPSLGYFSATWFNG